MAELPAWKWLVWRGELQQRRQRSLAAFWKDQLQTLAPFRLAEQGKRLQLIAEASAELHGDRGAFLPALTLDL